MCWGDAHPISRGFSTGTKLSSLSSVASRASDKNRLRSKNKKESGVETMGRSHFGQVVRSVIHRQLGPGVRGVTVTRTGDSVPAVGGGVSRKRRGPPGLCPPAVSPGTGRPPAPSPPASSEVPAGERDPPPPTPRSPRVPPEWSVGRIPSFVTAGEEGPAVGGGAPSAPGQGPAPLPGLTSSVAA